ncbi:magnesium-dependent phosphatase [Tolypocladium capitatum]|uniref:Magnesium-dependent phosphatase n=1 Tax=Tolypocladium capitatum TaxID=45235 RepID=A0A2K3QDF4_9HYPO|nr:magnesium-dependent phosphatase [Tolypocladium capitatum]
MIPRKLSKQALALSPSSTTLASPTAASSSLPASLADPSLPLPRLIVFDLDYTLWPFWVDTHVTPPLKPNAQHSAATDRCGEDFAFYGDVPAILQTLPQAGGGGANRIKLGVASRTSAPGLARDLLKMLHLPPANEGDKARRALDVFDGGMEIYPGSKIRHFETLQKRTGVRFEDMLFFDDESRNQETERLGLTMRLVRDGVTWDEVELGVEEWRRRRGYGRREGS